MDVTMVSRVGAVNYSEISSITLTKNTEQNKSETIKSKVNVSEKDTKKVVEKLNKLLEGEKTHAEYSFNKDFGDTVIKIVDNETKEVVNEFPSEKVINMVKKLCELAGVIIDRQA
jgi:flagellar protein FlaG